MGVRNPGDQHNMDEEQAKKLGAFLRQKREDLGLSLRGLEEIAGVNNVAILRLERGEQAEPAPGKLARIADALGLSLADVYSFADYAVPTDLPSFTPYLRTKYRDLPADEIDKIQAYAARLARKHGVDLNGPAPGQDEA